MGLGSVVLEMGGIVPGPPEVVWRLITDWEHQGDWMLEARDFVVTSEQRQGVGVEAEATIAIAGISTRDRIRISGWEPNNWLAVEHLGWVRGRGNIYLTPVGSDRTHVFWREELVPPLGIVGAIGLRVFRPLMGRIFRRDLRILSALVRAAAGAS